MAASRFFVILPFLALLNWTSLHGQDDAGQPLQSVEAPTITVSETGERVRLAAPGGIMRMQLQVFSDHEEPVFDGTVQGNVFDWNLQDGKGNRVADGEYLCVVTVKSLSGNISQRIGAVTLQGGMIALRTAQSASFTRAQQRQVGAIEDDATLTVLQEGDAPAATVVAHDGTDGRIVSTAGALTFGAGDFFAGTDREFMRLTADGQLGIGTDRPEATLDVAGDIRATGFLRAQKGIRFEDGTVQTTGRTSANGGIGTQAAGTGTLHRLPKWSETGGAGTLTDSAVSEVGGKVGIGTTGPPAHTLHVIGKTILQNTGAAALFIVDRTDGKIGALGAGGISSTFAYDATGMFKIESNSRANIAQGVFGLGATTRFVIDAAGNVAVGTSTAAAKLDVRGTQPPVSSDEGINAPDALRIIAGDGGGTTGDFASEPGTGGGVLIQAGNGGPSSNLRESKGGTIIIQPGLPGMAISPRLGSFAGKLLLAPVSGVVAIGTNDPACWDFMASSACLDLRGSLHVSDQAILSGGLRAVSPASGVAVGSFGSTGAFEIDAPSVVGGRMVVKENGNVGLGEPAPKARLHVKSGNVFIAHPNSLVITSPNGTCWFITVSDTGVLSSFGVPCP